MWITHVVRRAAEYLEHHLITTGAIVGLVIGLTVEFFDGLPVFSTNGASAWLPPNLAMLALCGGLAAYLFPKTLRRFDAMPNGEVVNVLMLTMGWVWGGLLVAFGFIAIVDGWLAAILQLFVAIGISMLFLGLMVILRGLGWEWPGEFLQAIGSSVAWRHEYLADKLETGRLGRWIDCLSRGDSVRE